MKLDYDPEVIVTYAQKLYARARWMMLRYAAATAALSAIAAIAISWAAPIPRWPLVLLATVVAAEVGRAKGFRLRLEAQQALCQVMLESHARSGLEALRRMGRGPV